MEAAEKVRTYLYRHVGHLVTAGRPVFDNSTETWTVPVLAKTEKGIFIVGEFTLDKDLNFVSVPTREQMLNVLRDAAVRVPILVFGDKEWDSVPTPAQKPRRRHTMSDCRNCGGTGKLDCNACDATGKWTCRGCDGTGEIECPRCKGSGQMPCPTCDESSGYFKFPERWVTCRRCNGVGTICCSLCGWGRDKTYLGSGKVTHRRCGGTGKIDCRKCSGSSHVTCRKCGGTGKFVRPYP